MSPSYQDMGFNSHVVNASDLKVRWYRVDFGTAGLIYLRESRSLGKSVYQILLGQFALVKITDCFYSPILQSSQGKICTKEKTCINPIGVHRITNASNAGSRRFLVTNGDNLLLNLEVRMSTPLGFPNPYLGWRWPDPLPSRLPDTPMLYDSYRSLLWHCIMTT